MSEVLRFRVSTRVDIETETLIREVRKGAGISRSSIIRLGLTRGLPIIKEALIGTAAYTGAQRRKA